jgi:hypothetical protein
MLGEEQITEKFDFEKFLSYFIIFKTLDSRASIGLIFSLFCISGKIGHREKAQITNV